MMIKIINGLLMMLMLACASASSADSDVDIVSARLAGVNERIITELGVLRANNTLNAKKTLLLIKKEASPIMDFRLLTRQAMGKHWRKADDTMRRNITEVFQLILENTYSKVFSRYNNQAMKITDSKKTADGNISALVEVQGFPAEIEYIFTKNKDGVYLISNIKIEGINLIATYRRQFSSVIRNKGLEGLLAELKKMADLRLSS